MISPARRDFSKEVWRIRGWCISHPGRRATCGENHRKIASPATRSAHPCNCHLLGGACLATSRISPNCFKTCFCGGPQVPTTSVRVATGGVYRSMHGPGTAHNLELLQTTCHAGSTMGAGDDFSSLASQRDLDSSRPRDMCHQRPRHVAVQPSDGTRACHHHSVSRLDILWPGESCKMV
jgi:hypothetical protein